MAVDRRNTDLSAIIHENAEVHGDCIIGARTVVWQFASVIRNSYVGQQCRIASCAIVDGSSIGDRCIISHGAFLDPGIAIGDDVFIGPHVALCNDPWPRVSKDGWWDIKELIGKEVIVTEVGNGASLGAGVVVMPGIRIGERAMIAAGSKVQRNVPADFLYYPNGVMVPIDTDRVQNRQKMVSDRL